MTESGTGRQKECLIKTCENCKLRPTKKEIHAPYHTNVQKSLINGGGSLKSYLSSPRVVELEENVTYFFGRRCFTESSFFSKMAERLLAKQWEKKKNFLITLEKRIFFY